MVRFCFAPNCWSGHKVDITKNKISLFKAPRDAVLLAKWNDSIRRKDRNITDKDHVCELHFEKHLVIKEWTAIHEGTVIMQIPVRAKLAKGAIPTLFNYYPVDPLRPLDTNVYRPTNSSFNVVETDKNSNSGYQSASCLSEVVFNNQDELQTIKREELSSSPKNVSDISSNDNTEIITGTCNGDLNISTLCKTVYLEVSTTETVPLTKTENVCVQNIDDLLDCFEKVVLPTKSWSVKTLVTEYVKSISFYECGFSKTNHIIVRKEVKVSEDMEASVFFLQKNIPLRRACEYPITIGDFQRILKEVDSLQICGGGPLKDSFPICQPETAYLDITGVWRHRKCEIAYDVDRKIFHCAKCSSLHETFRLQVRRKRLRNGVVRRRRTTQFPPVTA